MFGLAMGVWMASTICIYISFTVGRKGRHRTPIINLLLNDLW